jgi:hypothetical protein
MDPLSIVVRSNQHPEGARHQIRNRPASAFSVTVVGCPAISTELEESVNPVAPGLSPSPTGVSRSKGEEIMGASGPIPTSIPGRTPTRAARDPTAAYAQA